MAFKLTYAGYTGTYMQPPEAAEGIMDVACDPDEYGSSACGYVGDVDVSGDGTLWMWECPTCHETRETYHDIHEDPNV